MIAVLFLNFTNNPGGDYYKILLNNKLVAEQFLTQPKALAPLALTASSSKDQLTIQFSHCGAAGKNRTISLKDEKGQILKEWKFSDSKSTEMQLAVKEIIQASSKASKASIYYASKEKPSGQFLTMIELKRSGLAKL